jgi:hypothetical protein
VELYLSQHGGKADPNALYILEGGGNDILDTTNHSPETLGLHIAEPGETDRSYRSVLFSRS